MFLAMVRLTIEIVINAMYRTIHSKIDLYCYYRQRLQKM